MAELGSIAHSWLFALAGGIIPALLWLWFWLQEDKLHPEPRGRILLAFWGGMIMVPLVYPLEKLVMGEFGQGTTTFFLWAVIEETAKFAAVWFFALRSKAYDEPIDAMEYMITAALGFAALENTFFILNPLMDGEAFQGLMTTNMRFLGASILHVVASGVLGYCIGREFFKSAHLKALWRSFGLALAIALHTVFNLSIIYWYEDKTFTVFAFVWAAALVVMLLFEKLKKQIN